MSKNLALETHAPAYLSVHDIHAYYGESYIVQGVSFNVHEGEILALLGRNGAGKTSTLRTIARLDNPELVKGEIWLDHKNIHANLEIVHRELKYIFLIRRYPSPTAIQHNS